MRLTCASLLLCAVAAATAGAQSAGDEFTAAVFADRSGTQLPYRLLPPKSLSPGHKYPLIVQLHGSGAIGTDNRAQIGAFSNGWLQPDVRARFAAFILVPQFPARTVDYPEVRDPSQLRSHPTALLDVAIRLIEKTAAEQAIDRSRIYVIGFSMGASTALQAITTRPELFAAAVAIAPVPPADTRIPARPILVMHGDADTENPFATSQQWARSMKARGATIEFRSYPGLQHELPQDALTATWWREWLFAQKITR